MEADVTYRFVLKDQGKVLELIENVTELLNKVRELAEYMAIRPEKVNDESDNWE
jgi:hypothetical protein